MANRTFYNEILTDHNMRPMHKHDLPDANMVLEGVNPSCGDDIFLKLKVENDEIVDGSFVGSGCAISQASADIMLELSYVESLVATMWRRQYPGPATACVRWSIAYALFMRWGPAPAGYTRAMPSG